ncbi:hypothetical protein CP500_018435 [Tychonema bourrellyi FEM_GT703]|uniref:Uncharacterized protein n=1 Tax=Tychonema bourrellyi FEM_GT703 TaxID=2040638 RepID=A0A2G4EWV5_9CYAN|nr:hypothetical protein CP500_018435 [Tychonema bourrellyi FEM_GT703]
MTAFSEANKRIGIDKFILSGALSLAQLEFTKTADNTGQRVATLLVLFLSLHRWTSFDKKRFQLPND